MRIYLLDTNKTICKAWEHDFGNAAVVVNDNLEHFLDNNDVECIVSPANSKGEMYGGYDRAITDYFGKELTNNVQRYIKENYPNGLQPVGTSLIFDIPNHMNKKLIHTPSMIRPIMVDDPKVVYDCMKATLECAVKNNIKSIVIPAFCGGTGGIDPYTVSNQMLLAYNEVMTK